jgi:hypothetical protein
MLNGLLFVLELSLHVFSLLVHLLQELLLICHELLHCSLLLALVELRCLQLGVESAPV